MDDSPLSDQPRPSEIEVSALQAMLASGEDEEGATTAPPDAPEEASPDQPPSSEPSPDEP